MYLRPSTFNYHNDHKGKTGRKGTTGPARKKAVTTAQTKPNNSFQPHGGCRPVHTPYGTML